MDNLFSNLQTGLAVGDISETLKSSLSHRLRSQIEVHHCIELLLPRNVNRQWKMKLQSYKYYPNMQKGWLDEVDILLAFHGQQLMIT